jgi:hypothetical protein
MSALEEEKENKRRILELKADFDKHMDALDLLGEKPKTMSGQLQEFLSVHKDWLIAFSNEELATIFYQFSWGTNVKSLNDGEKWRRRLAIDNMRKMICNIRLQSESTLPTSTKGFDSKFGKYKWRIVNLTKKTDLGKRKNVTTSIKDGMDRQDDHIDQIFRRGEKARHQALIEERRRRKRRSP